jgi:hypothetical protein
MIAPVISLTVVLPLLPVMPMTAPGNSRRHAACEARHANQRVVHDDLGQRHVYRAADDCAGDTAGGCIGHEIVAIEALAGQRDEQGIALELPRVRQHATEWRVGAAQRAACRKCKGLQVARGQDWPSASAARTTSRSLKGRVSVPTTW